MFRCLSAVTPKSFLFYCTFWYSWLCVPTDRGIIESTTGLHLFHSQHKLSKEQILAKGASLKLPYRDAMPSYTVRRSTVFKQIIMF